MKPTFVACAAALVAPWLSTHSPWAGAALAAAAAVLASATAGLRGALLAAGTTAVGSGLIFSPMVAATLAAGVFFHGAAVGRFGGRGSLALAEPWPILRFVLLAGPGGAAAAALCWGLRGDTPNDALLALWRAAAVGGAVGGLVGCCLLAEPRTEWRSRLLPMAVPLALLVAFVAGTEIWAARTARNENAARTAAAVREAESELDRLADGLTTYRPRTRENPNAQNHDHLIRTLFPATVHCGGFATTNSSWMPQVETDAYTELELTAIDHAANASVLNGRVVAVAGRDGRVILVAPVNASAGSRSMAVWTVDTARLRADWPERGVTILSGRAGGTPGGTFSALGAEWTVAVPTRPADPTFGWGASAVAVAAAGLLLGMSGSHRRAAAAADARSRDLESRAHAGELALATLAGVRDRATEANRLARVGFLEWNPVTGEADWSDVVAEVIGRKPDGKFATFLEAVPFADRPKFQGWAEGVIRGRGRGEYELRVVRPDGSEAWVAVGMTAAPGIELSVLASVQDISSRKRAEAAVRSSEEQFRRSFEATAVAKALIRPDGQFFRVNAAMSEFLGYTAAELLARNLHRVTHADDLHKDFVAVADCLAGLVNGYEVEKRYVRRDGRVAWGLLSASIVRDPAGRPDHFVCQIIDVTARKSAEAELQASETRLAEAQRLAQIGNWEWHPADKRVWWSDNLYRLLGYEPRSVPATIEAMLERVHPDDRRMVEGRIAAAADGTRPYDYDFRVVLPDGEVRWWHAEALIDREVTGLPVRWRGTVQDVTDRKEAEDLQRQYDDRLRQTQKLESLGVLAGGVAHDFNNLLTGILGNAALIREKLPAESGLHEYLRTIEQAGTHAAGLCQQMLAYAGKRTAVRGAFQLSRLIAESAELLRLSVAKKVELIYDLAPDLPSSDGDAAQIRQVLLNLVSNASEAIGDATGRITVRTGAETLAEPAGGLDPGRYVWVEVTDTGCGMSADVAARIFDPFFTTKFTGRGLGLSAVHGIAKMHGGGVTVDSAPGRGTTFRVAIAAGEDDLSLTPAPVYYTPVSIPHPAQRAPEPILPGSEAGFAVVADDEPAVRKLAALTLRNLGFTVREADNGRDAVALVLTDPANTRIVLLDVTMPELDGKEAAAAIHLIAPAAPIVIMSGYTELDLNEQFGAGDVSGFVQKPFRSADLIACIRGAIARNERRTKPQEV